MAPWEYRVGLVIPSHNHYLSVISHIIMHKLFSFLLVFFGLVTTTFGESLHPTTPTARTTADYTVAHGDTLALPIGDQENIYYKMDDPKSSSSLFGSHKQFFVADFPDRITVTTVSGDTETFVVKLVRE